MKLRRIFAVVLGMILVFAIRPNTTALALSDIDFTIDVDTVTQYVSGDKINCPIRIKTQTDKGFVEMELFLKFDPDALNCLSIFEDVDGFSTKVDERNGETGLLIYYSSPTNEATKKDEETVIRVQFAVITGVATGDYTLDLEVLSCYGFDAYGNKENAVEKENVLTLSMAKAKKLEIVETNDNSVGNSTGDGSDPNFYYTQPSTVQEVDNKKSGGSVFGKVVLFVLGAAIVFGAGVIVGFVLCQKRMNEDAFDSRNSEPAAPPRRFADSMSAFGNISGKFGKSVYDEPEEPVTDYYNERISGRKAAPARRQPAVEDDDIDTSYFGRAAESQLGGRTAYDDVYSDDYAPRQQRAAAPEQQPQEETYGSYDFIGSRSRRERSDDGYGSFSASEFEEDDDPNQGYGGQNYGGEQGYGEQTTDYHADRRRYR